MIFTFHKARGLSVGKSLVEEDKLALAKELEAKAAAKGVRFLLPTDVVLADDFKPDANSQIAKVETIPDGWVGMFEFDKFAAGTNGIAHTLAALDEA